jgi:hypothetical protein
MKIDVSVKDESQSFGASWMMFGKRFASLDVLVVCRACISPISTFRFLPKTASVHDAVCDRDS